MANVFVPTRHRLSVADFQRMAQTDILNEDDRIELLAGDLIDMAPIGSEHAGVIDWLTQQLVLATALQAIVRIQGPHILDEHSQPQPGLLVLRARDDFYRQAHPCPADVLLLIEVADTSIRFDRDVKIPLYARHGVPEVWLVDLAKRYVEVYREPRLEAGQYREMTTHSHGALSPERLPMVAIEVDQLF
jgi:Uma2 family endonuclease